MTASKRMPTPKPVAKILIEVSGPAASAAKARKRMSAALVTSRLEVVAHHPVDLGQAGTGDATQRDEQGADVITNDPVEDLGADLAGLDQPGSTQHLQVGRSIGDAHPGGVRQGVDAALGLRDQLQKLDASWTGRGLGDQGEVFVQPILDLATLHDLSQNVQCSMEY